jgi:hypothetical protein
MELIETNLLDKLDRPSRPSEKSEAAAKAKQLGLTYLGFGRYGILNKDRKIHVTHVVKREKLVPIAQTDWKTDKTTGRIQTTEPIGKEFDSWKRKYGKKHEKDIESAKKVADDYVLGPLDPIDLHSTFDDKMGAKLAKIQKNNANLYYQAGVHKIKGLTRILDEFTDTTDDVNRHLYNGKSADRFEERRATWKIRSMDALFKKPEFKAHHDYTVYTGTKANLKPGNNYLFKGYLSTSLTPSTAHDFVDSDKGSFPTIIQIDIKKGQPVIDINAAYDAYSQDNNNDFISNEHEHEMEHLLPRGSKLKVTEGPYFMDDVQYFRAEIVSENEEDDDE